MTGIFNSVRSAVQSLPVLKPDLVLLDMELHDGKGFDILEPIPEINFEIIITTQHDSFLMQAIKHSALDYILKPVKKDELKLALKKFEKKSSETNSALKNYHSSQPEKIFLTMNTEYLIVPRRSADYLYCTYFAENI